MEPFKISRVSRFCERKIALPTLWTKSGIYIIFRRKMMQQPHGQHRYPPPGPQVRSFQQPGYPGVSNFDWNLNHNPELGEKRTVLILLTQAKEAIQSLCIFINIFSFETISMMCCSYSVYVEWNIIIFAHAMAMSNLAVSCRSVALRLQKVGMGNRFTNSRSKSLDFFINFQSLQMNIW